MQPIIFENKDLLGRVTITMLTTIFARIDFVKMEVYNNTIQIIQDLSSIIALVIGVLTLFKLTKSFIKNGK